MTTQDFIDFIKLCAEKHPEIQHRDYDENDTSHNVRFSTNGSKIFLDTTAGGKLEVKEFCVIINTDEFSAPFFDSKAQSYKDYSLNFEICKYVNPSDDQEKLLAQQNAERIGQDFCNELKYYILNDIPPFDRGTDLATKITGDPTSGGKSNLCGHRFEIPIRTPIPGVESHTSFTQP